jgi:DNA polymerase-3 subunit alpha
LQQAIDGEPRIKQLQRDDEAVARLLEIALQLEGLYRHASTHAAGVVIGDRPLMELVPLYRDPKSEFLVTQYSMKYVEQAGLVKFDFLGLTTLTILQRAVQFLGKIGTTIDLEALPLDDAATYAMLGRGDAAGVFQFESPGMRDVLRQMRPDRFEDLIAAGALYRPGPMANIPAYCARKHGEAWSAPHPDLHDILAETYGIMVYQEQVMQIAQRMAGYSLGAADLLRRAMGKKIRAEMEQQRKIFTEGAEARGITPAKAEEVFDLMAKFADYGFNRSHAAAYALVSYQTAWMKANQPVAFIAACMSLALDNTDKLAGLRQEAGRLGIAVLPPDINRSSADFTLEELPDGSYAIRYALAAVKRVGRAAMQSLEQARGGTAYTSIADFAARIDPRQLNKMQIENLVRAGAFDSLDTRRAVLFAGADTILRRAQAQAEEKASGQVAMFADAAQPDTLPLPKVEAWQQIDQLSYEAEAIGFHLTAHPLDAYAASLRRLGVIPSNRIAGASGRVRLAGSITAIKERITQKGSRMAWVRLSDAAGSFEVTLFSEVLARSRDVVTVGQMVLVSADLKAEGEALRITVQDITPLDQAAAAAGASMRIWIAESAAVPHIRALLEREPRSVGRGHAGRVLLMPYLDGAQQVEITLPGYYTVTPRLAQAITAVPGVERVEDV